MDTKRIAWADGLRGLCMLSILLMHTEVYYTGDNIINYNLYTPCTLNLFFFISGYFLYRRGGFNFRHKLLSMAKGLLLPYFVFTLAMAIPKAMAHDTQWQDNIINVFTGQSSWFVAALLVAELMFCTLLYIGRGKHSVLFVGSMAGLCLSVCLSTNFPPLWWQTDNALLALPLLYLGYAYHEKEKFFNHFNRTSYTLPILLLFLLMKAYIQVENVRLLVFPIIINSYPIFFLDSTLTIFLLTNAAKRLPSMGWMEWIGRHSLVIYFLCGAVPLLTSMAFSRMGLAYNGNYIRVLMAFVAVCIISSALAWAVYRYLPFTVGRWPK